MKEIKLSGKYGIGKIAIVDDEDFDIVSKHNWYVHDLGYAITTRSRKDRANGSKFIRMHRLIMGNPEGKVIDHANSDKLDNRKSNLRICTQSENCTHTAVRKTKNKTSLFKGVYKDKRREINPWNGRIYLKGKKYWLGTFEKEIDAAKAYNEKAKELFGEFAILNTL